jgi:hypothetical protein
MASEIEAILVGTAVNGKEITLQHLPAGTIEPTDVWLLVVEDEVIDISEELFEFLKQQVQSGKEKNDESTSG